MSITSSASPGIIVTSAAKNGTLGTQGAIANNEILFDSAITTNNGNLAASPTFVGRIVVLRRGAADEEIRYITANSTTTQCTVNEDWVVNPASADTYEISYIIQDAATLTGLSLATKRVQDYTSGRRFTIGSGGGTFALFSLLNGASLETSDNSSTTVADFIVENGGWFINGYTTAGTAVSGGYIIGVPAVDGELVFDSKAGSTAILNDWFLTCVKQNKAYFNGNTSINKVKLFSASYDTEMLGALSGSGLTIEGKSATTDVIVIDTSFASSDITLISTNGFVANVVATETINLDRVTFVNNLKLFTISSNKTINLIDPTNFTPDTATQNDINFVGTGAVLNEKYSLNTTVQDSTATAIADPRLFLYEGLLNDTIANDLTGNTTGEISSSWLYKSYTDNAGTSLTVSTEGTHAIRAYKYGYNPFISSITSNEPFSSPITLTLDTNVQAANGEFANTAGAGVIVTRRITGDSDPRPLTVMDYANGSTLMVAGDAVSGVSSGATGTVVEVIGDAASGTVVLKSRNAIEFTNAEDLNVSAAKVAEADVTGFYEKYSWEVACGGNPLQEAYDYLSYKMQEPTLDTIFTNAHIWGAAENSRLLYSTGSAYYTQRNTTDSYGVWVSNTGSGSISYLTSDDGTLYVPPVQYSFVITGLVSGTEVKIYDTDTNQLITGTESSGTSFTYNYVYGGTPINIVVIVFSLLYKDIRLTGLTLADSNQSIPVQQQTDRIYST